MEIITLLFRFEFNSTMSKSVSLQQQPGESSSQTQIPEGADHGKPEDFTKSSITTNQKRPLSVKDNANPSDPKKKAKIPNPCADIPEGKTDVDVVEIERLKRKFVVQINVIYPLAGWGCLHQVGVFALLMPRKEHYYCGPSAIWLAFFMRYE